VGIKDETDAFCSVALIPIQGNDIRLLAWKARVPFAAQAENGTNNEGKLPRSWIFLVIQGIYGI
jgi:hypothetical protein